MSDVVLSSRKGSYVMPAHEVRKNLGKVIIDDGCWPWGGPVGSNGYGRVATTTGVRRGLGAHRFVFEALVGPIPDGMKLDHVCHNTDLTCAGGDTCLHRRCVNPAHLEPVTDAENLRRSPHVVGAHSTHCQRGHEFSEANTYTDKRGGRNCRACQRMADARFRQRRAEARRG